MCGRVPAIDDNLQSTVVSRDETPDIRRMTKLRTSLVLLIVSLVAVGCGGGGGSSGGDRT